MDDADQPPPVLHGQWLVEAELALPVTAYGSHLVAGQRRLAEDRPELDVDGVARRRAHQGEDPDTDQYQGDGQAGGPPGERLGQDQGRAQRVRPMAGWMMFSYCSGWGTKPFSEVSTAVSCSRG